MTDPADPPPGWFTDPDGRTRWWDGTAWVEPEPQRAVVRVDGAWSDADRREVLDRAVATYARHGYTVRSRSAYRAVVAKRQRLQVLPALLLTLITGGLWLIVLAIRLTDWPVDAVALTVDEHGTLIPEFSS